MQERAQTMEPETPAPREETPAAALVAPAPLVMAHPARCVTLRRAAKACQACVEACPAACLTVEGNAVTVNEAACVECGVCVSVCPSAVFELTRFGEGMLEDALDDALALHERVTVTCRRAPARAEGDTGPRVMVECLAVLGEVSLAMALQEGGEIELQAPCEKCQLVTGREVIESNVARARVLLSLMEGAGAVSFTLVEPGEGGVDAGGLSRRDVLRGFGRDLARAALSRLETLRRFEIPNGRLTAEMIPSRKRKLNRLIGGLARKEAELTEAGSPFRIVEVSQACEVKTCYACASYCPSQALRRVEEPQNVWLEFTGVKCLKCESCADLCPRGAISYRERFAVSALAAEPVLFNVAEKKQCVKCERPFTPKGSEVVCPACNKFGNFVKYLISDKT